MKLTRENLRSCNEQFPMCLFAKKKEHEKGKKMEKKANEKKIQKGKQHNEKKSFGSSLLFGRVVDISGIPQALSSTANNVTD